MLRIRKYAPVAAAMFLGLAASPALAEDCPAPADWFPHGQTPWPDGEDFKSTSNCVFQQWSWQAFLFLTQIDPNTGEPFFEGLIPWLALDKDSPVAKTLTEADALLPRRAKSADPTTLDRLAQAGTDGILVDHNGRAVYYSMAVNQEFADFTTSNNLSDPKALAAFSDTTDFPIDAVEIKIAWKIVEDGENTDNIYSRKAKIYPLMKNDQGQIVLNTSETETATVALIGFHIGGVVNGHPEMIWATFEHDQNAPNVPDPTNIKPETVVSDKDFTFYKAGTPFSECNVNPIASGEMTLDEETQILTPVTQVCRMYKYGNANTTTDRAQTNDSNIEQLNDEVRAQLAKEKSVWQNYYEVGAIWFNEENALTPNQDFQNDGLLTGSINLSNSVIETFTQTQNTMDNCIACHNTEQAFPPESSMDALPGKNVNISHLLLNFYFMNQ